MYTVKFTQEKVSSLECFCQETPRDFHSSINQLIKLGKYEISNFYRLIVSLAFLWRRITGYWWQVITHLFKIKPDIYLIASWHINTYTHKVLRCDHVVIWSVCWQYIMTYSKNRYNTHTCDLFALLVKESWHIAKLPGCYCWHDACCRIIELFDCVR